MNLCIVVMSIISLSVIWESNDWYFQSELSKDISDTYSGTCWWFMKSKFFPTWIRSMDLFFPKIKEYVPPPFLDLICFGTIRIQLYYFFVTLHLVFLFFEHVVCDSALDIFSKRRHCFSIFVSWISFFQICMHTHTHTHTHRHAHVHAQNGFYRYYTL